MAPGTGLVLQSSDHLPNDRELTSQQRASFVLNADQVGRAAGMGAEVSCSLWRIDSFIVVSCGRRRGTGRTRARDVRDPCRGKLRMVSAGRINHARPVPASVRQQTTFGSFREVAGVSPAGRPTTIGATT